MPPVCLAVWCWWWALPPACRASKEPFFRFLLWDRLRPRWLLPLEKSSSSIKEACYDGTPGLMGRRQQLLLVLLPLLSPFVACMAWRSSVNTNQRTILTVRSRCAGGWMVLCMLARSLWDHGETIIPASMGCHELLRALARSLPRATITREAGGF